MPGGARRTSGNWVIPNELGNELGNGELKELTMDTYISTGKAVLSDLYRHYNKAKLDDAEYIPVVRVIIKGIAKALTEAGVDKKEVKAVEKALQRFNLDLYLKGWLKNAKEELGKSEFDMEKETEAGTYYFYYIYKHGEHPR
jgi:ATP-dependent Lon protease